MQTCTFIEDYACCVSNAAHNHQPMRQDAAHYLQMLDIKKRLTWCKPF